MCQHRRSARSGKSITPLQGTTDFPGKVNTIYMDVSNVPNEINGTKDNILVSTFETNSTENINSTVSTPNIDPEKGKIHRVILAIIIALFSFVVVYCLFMQIWWILGVLAIPLLGKAMIKIIDRYV